VLFLGHSAKTLPCVRATLGKQFSKKNISSRCSGSAGHHNHAAGRRHHHHAGQPGEEAPPPVAAPPPPPAGAPAGRGRAAAARGRPRRLPLGAAPPFGALITPADTRGGAAAAAIGCSHWLALEATPPPRPASAGSPCCRQRWREAGRESEGRERNERGLIRWGRREPIGELHPMGVD